MLTHAKATSEIFSGMAETPNSSAPRLDFLIAASPSPAMLSQVAFFRMCLNALGGAYGDARLVVTLGDHDVETLPGDWRRYFDGIEVEWAHAPGAANPLHRAQHDRRFEVIRPNADVVVLCDADVALMRPFDELIADLMIRPAIAGVIAHYPFTVGSAQNVPIEQRTPEKDWRELSRKFIGKSIDCPYRFTLLDPDSEMRTPFYLNYGVVAGTPDIFSDFYKQDTRIRDQVSADVGDWWGPQISLTLAVAALDLPSKALPMRYNFPNDPRADNLYPDELKDVIFMHYLRTTRFNRSRIFADPEAFEDFIGSHFLGSNEVFRRFVEQVTGGSFPFNWDGSTPTALSTRLFQRLRDLFR